MSDAASRAAAAPPRGRPRTRTRLLVALAVGLFSAAYVVARAIVRHAPASDVDLIWASARALLAGLDPYAVVGPGGSFYQYPFRMYYPFTAVIAGLPLTPLTEAMVGPTFSFVAGAALAYVLSRDGFDRLPVLASGAYLGALLSVQWSPMLTVAALVPWLGWLLAVKPNVGAALWTYGLEARAAVLALALVALSFVVRPDWLTGWAGVLRYSDHFRAPVQHAGGFLLLLALLRWRRPEARLLVALACVPHTTLAYEALPLALVPRTRIEAMTYALLTWPVLLGQIWLADRAPSFAAQTDLTGDLMVALVYLPCLIMVLRRPNEGEVPAWLARPAAAVRTALVRAPGSEMAR